MEIWVKSQDKSFFGVVKELKFRINKSDNSYVIMSKGEILGEYKSRKRCIEVIDEFQEFTKKHSILIAFYNANITYEEAKVIRDINIVLLREDNSTEPQPKCETHSIDIAIYEMPKE